MTHAFEWTNGSLADLGTLEFNPEGNFSQAFWVNDQGVSAVIRLTTLSALQMKHLTDTRP